MGSSLESRDELNAFSSGGWEHTIKPLLINSPKFTVSLTNGLPWFLGLAGFVCIFCLAFFDLGANAQWLAISCIFSIEIFTVGLHEGAHLIAAVLFKLFPITVQLGSGDSFLEIRGKQLSLVLKMWPNCGMVIPSYPPGRIFPYWRSVVLYLAGPAMDVLLFSALVWLLTSPPQLWRDIVNRSQLDMVLGVCAGYLIYAHLVHLWPKRTRMEEEEVPNDMRYVLDLTKAKLRNPGAEAFYASLGEHIHNRSSETADKVRALFTKAIARSLDSDESNAIRDYLCTMVLFFGLRDLLELADCASRELVEMRPDEVTYKGTRGGVLVELDKAEGASLLEGVVELSVAQHDRSISAAFLALFYHRRAQSAEANKWMRKARDIDENCPAVRRARAEILERALSS